MSGKWSIADFVQVGLMLAIGWCGAVWINKVWAETVAVAANYLK